LGPGPRTDGEGRAQGDRKGEREKPQDLSLQEEPPRKGGCRQDWRPHKTGDRERARN
jgi:hypothetical protein